MTKVTVELPDTVFSVLHCSPRELDKELCLAASAHWYQQGRISQEWAAKIAGMDRPDFLLALAQMGKGSFIVDFDELDHEIARGQSSNHQRISVDLLRCRHLDLLSVISKEIWVPNTVASEILRRGKSDITAIAIEKNGWLIPKNAEDIPSQFTDWRLGPGEPSVLALLKWTLVVKRSSTIWLGGNVQLDWESRCAERWESYCAWMAEDTTEADAKAVVLSLSTSISAAVPKNRYGLFRMSD